MKRYENIPLFIDLVFCIILLPLLSMLLPVDRWMTHDPTYVYLMTGWLYFVYIIDRVVVIPFAFRKGRFSLYSVLIFAASIVVTYMITRYQMEIPYRMPRHFGRGNMTAIPRHIQQQAVWFLYITVVSFSVAVGLLSQLYRQMIEKQAIEVEKKKAELALYKAQINPHFLFNTLNTLYGMIVTKSDKTEQAFTEFTNLMKYMYSSASRDNVPIESEVQYISDYISLQKYRIPAHTSVDFDYSHDGTEKSLIAPMILVTFVENAFKYGVSSTESTQIDVAIRAEEGRLHFSVKNTFLNHVQGKESKGIGITNCKERLELLYKDRYSLDIGMKDGVYSVILDMDLRK